MFSDKFKAAYLDEVGISDKSAHKNAYETAHRIREFEIELYWKRTTYIWAMQAAFIGLSLLIRTYGDTTIVLDFPLIRVSTEPSLSSLIASTLISTLALIVASLWFLMLSGAKFWQDNWERHVDILGETLCQNLYQVYPVYGKTPNPPYSVTKINSYIATSFIIFWIINLLWSLWGITSVCSVLGGIPFFFAFLAWIGLYALFIFFLLCHFRKSIFFKSLRMSNFGNEIYKEEENKESSVLVSRRRRSESNAQKSDLD